MNELEARVGQALRDSGDVGAALTWTQVLDELAGDFVVAVTCGHGENGPRWRKELPEVDGVRWVWIEPEVEGVGLGGQFRLLGAHALVYLTPITSPLGQHDRERLDQLGRTAPATRGVLLADEALLERLSDDPTTERAAVVARLEGLLPDDWLALDRERLTSWISTARTDPQLRGLRRRSVATVLLADRIAHQERMVDQASTQLTQVREQLDQADEELERLRQQSRRWAAHTLAILKRQTAQLALDLAEYLREVEASLPTQINDVEDVALLRRTLPHWLSHVVETWLEDRVARWRRDVLQELEELELEDPLGASLVVPALQPGLMKGETRWAHRLATTAAFGGAAALLALGLWIPSLLAVAGGIAWSTAQRGGSEAEERRSMLGSAREALRQMGEDAERLLAEQLDQLEHDLQELTTELPEGESEQQLRGLLEGEASRIEEEITALQERALALQTVLEAVHG